ncbi:MAG: hypothetical protein U9O20_04350 [Patescibacteria group bacterium]|nr:hypothetical protein [Patescibacteria group bacterium]
MLRKIWTWISEKMEEMENTNKEWREFRMKFVKKNGYDPFHPFDDDFDNL